MAERIVGWVERIWRYPVKSMQGEELDRVDITPTGLRGDRAYALWDEGTARVASAKNPRLWRSLLAWHARFLEEPGAGPPLPPVAIHSPAPSPDSPADMPSVEPLLSSDPAIDASLSDALGRPVRLLDQPPEGASLDQYWPPVQEREFQDVVNELVLPAGTFFDSCPLHAISTATLERLRQLETGLDFAVERFRPNLLIRPVEGADGFVEEQWIGRALRLGASLELHVSDGCPRCVVTTLAQGNLPEDLGILRATARHNRVVAGIRLSVRRPGVLAVGDPITLLDGD